jgi:DNA-binding transcriptional LysR family regulator
MNIDHLKAFVQIVKLGSFTKASESLFVPQPTLSIRIQQLEKELDIQLFNRHKKNVSLTSAGIHFYDFASNTLNSFEQTQLALKKMKQEIISAFPTHWDISLSN